MNTTNEITNAPTLSIGLVENHGFECKEDYCKNIPEDEFYSLKMRTYKKKIVGKLEIHVTDVFEFVEAPDVFKYIKTIVELVQCAEFTELKKVDTQFKLLKFINLLNGDNFLVETLLNQKKQ
jgi:hypothetical protein